jgi:hypothetical protein
MKRLFTLLAAICLLSCGHGPLREQIRVVFPVIPALWKEILGEPHWRLEWYDTAGIGQCAEIPAPAAAVTTPPTATVDILVHWPNAVLAWPYWPGKGVSAGLFRPAGAIYPLDARGEKITLTWRAGIDAHFYRELDKVRPLNASNRAPEYFDWKHFRAALWQTAPEDLQADPWLADWQDIAEKTVKSGFRQSLLKAETRKNTVIALPHDGPWLFASIFKPPQQWRSESAVTLPVGKHPEILACPGGFLSVTQKDRLWQPFWE